MRGDEDTHGPGALSRARRAGQSDTHLILTVRSQLIQSRLPYIGHTDVPVACNYQTNHFIR